MRLAFILVFLSYILTSVCPGQEPSAKSNGQAELWMARFEQSYGTEGMYVVEVEPKDPGANSRMNLQQINAFANQYLKDSGKSTVDLATLKSLGAMEDLKPVPDGLEYVWDDIDSLFVTSLGGIHDPGYGAVSLLRANTLIRMRILSPDKFVRARWKRLYKDPNAPLPLKQEIELREFLLTNWEYPEAEIAEITNDRLSKLEEAIKMYAVINQKNVGDPITLDELIESRISGFVERPPDGVTVEVTEIGKPPIGIYDGAEITSDPASVMAYRRKKAEPLFEKFLDYPPALALKARLSEPEEATELLNQAILTWPNVPALRLERMNQNARSDNFDRWTDDLDFILTKFPAAPLLLEVRLSAEVSGIAALPEPKARFATTLADVRPDLLAPQLHALETLKKAGDLKTAKSVWDRLVYANPAWRAVIREPEPVNMVEPEPTEEVVAE